MAALEGSARAALSARGEGGGGTETLVTPLRSTEDKYSGTAKPAAARKSTAA
ncbi:hypothetical protein ACFYWU_41960 [Streptomyces chrestomyceticus]|uniref:hypothetical protein n=1 Tax=Streptomyces chrestomyceticus TaxID=68185 RepID=UPI003698F990